MRVVQNKVLNLLLVKEVTNTSRTKRHIDSQHLILFKFGKRSGWCVGGTSACKRSMTVSLWAQLTDENETNKALALHGRECLVALLWWWSCRLIVTSWTVISWFRWRRSVIVANCSQYAHGQFSLVKSATTVNYSWTNLFNLLMHGQKINSISY